MEKSIESIWKEGFLKSDALIAPRINDLYNKKSQLIIDKLKRMFGINLVAIAIGAFLLLVLSFFIKVPLIGTFMFLLLFWLVLYGRKQIKNMQNIDTSVSSYQYLKSFKNWIKDMINSYTKIYQFFYPLFFLALFSAMWLITMDDLIAKFPNIYLVNGIPLYWSLGAFIFAGLSGIFAGTIYRWDINIIYGHAFKKLDEILADMEDLKA